MPNGGSVPIIIVHDIEKYNTSGATPLSQFKDNSSEIPFKRLPGDKKGREFNQPVLYMTKSFKELGDSSYKIIPSLSKLLNVSEDEIRASRKPMSESEFISENEYADFNRFTAITDNCYQAYAGNIIYAVKDKPSSANLIDLAEQLQGQQHAIFPKSNLENIPFSTLDSFGLDSSIISRGFLNPEDALKVGYRLTDLNKIHLQGEVSILPVSINKDLSINFINNVAELSQLAYSNYKWQKNIGLVNDYNALVAVREASRNILNARPSAVQTAEKMEKIIEDLSTTLQNFNESNNIQKTHKSIKYFNNGVTTHLIKNDQNEWRYIEKDGSKKIDLPLTWENYQKAITTLANYNTIITSALQLEVKHGADFDKALTTVFANHLKIYKAHTQVVENVSDVTLTDKLIINTNGQKVSKDQLARFTNEFDRDMGETLYAESVKQMLSGMREIKNPGDIKNVVGGRIVDDFEITKNATIVPSNAVTESVADLDIGLSVLDSFQKDEAINLDGKLDQERNKLNSGVDLSLYNVLPKSINPLIDENHPMANDIYKTLQHMELSEIPWYENALSKIKNDIQGISAEKNNDLHSGYAEYLKKGDSTLEDSHLDKQNNHQLKLDGLNAEFDRYKNGINQIQTQANILRYQFNKLLGEQRNELPGLLAFKADENGNYIPFEDKYEYRSITQQLKNQFLKENTDQGGLVEYRGPIKEKLNSFVVSHFNITSIDLEANDSEKVDQLAKVRNDLTIVSPTYVGSSRLPISQKAGLDFHLSVLTRVEESLKNYSATPESNESLNNSLIAIARLYSDLSNKVGVELNPTAAEQDNLQLKEFLKFEGSLDYPISREYLDVATGVPVSDIRKIELLKSVVDQSVSSIWNTPEFDALDGIVPISKLIAKATNEAQIRVMQIPLQEYQQELAGRFLVSHQYSMKESVQGLGVGKFFGYTVGTDADNFKVRVFNENERNDNIVALDYSRTYNSAVRKAFEAYQLHDTASKLGVDSFKLENIKNLAVINAALNTGRDVEPNPELSKAIFGRELTANDLSSFKSLPSNLRDPLGNKIVQFEGDDIGVFSTNIENGMKLMASVSLVNKLSGVESKFYVSPIVERLDNLTEFDKVQQYLMPDAAEFSHINTMIHAEKDVENLYENLPDAMSKFAIMAYKDAQAKDILIDPNSVAVATTIPMKQNDGVISRIIPNSWKIKLIDSDGSDYNVTSIKENQDGLTPQIVSGYIHDHQKFGSEYYTRPSAPILEDNAIQNETIALSLDEQNVLQGGLGFNDGSFADQVNLNATVAATNYQVAMNNMPARLKEQLQEYINGDEALHSVPVRVSMQKPAENHVPRLSISTFNTEYGTDDTYIMRVDLRELKQIMEAGGFPPEQYDGTVKLSPNLLCTQRHDRCLKQMNFDLYKHAEVAAIRNGNHDFRYENPLSVIDQLQPIQFEESQLSSGRLNYTRNVFAELLPKNIGGVEVDGLKIVDKAKVFIRSDNENVSIALAHSAETAQKYIDEGYLATYKSYAPFHQPLKDGVNIFNQLSDKTIDIDERNKLVGQFFDIVDEAYAAKIQSNEASQPAPVEATDELIHNVAESISHEKSTNALRVETQFAEKLNAYTLEQLQAMRPAELADKVTISKIWPTESIDQHLASSHQQLDTFLLGKTLRDSLQKKEFALRQDSSLEKDAMDYNFFLVEMHNAVSKARTPEELLVNFDKAYKNTVARSPEYFSTKVSDPELAKQNHILKDFQGAAYNHVHTGMSASDALKLGVADSPFAKQYQLTAKNVGEHENLYSNEKPFVQYLDGFTLNASGNEAELLNTALITHFASNRLDSSLNLDRFEAIMPIVDRKVIDELSARNRIDFNAEQSNEDLKAKWGVNFEVAPNDAHLAHGYNKLANQLLSELHSKLPENSISPEVLGRGVSIQAGQPRNLDDGKDIYITSIEGGVKGNYSHFSNQYALNLIRSIEQQEISLMDKQELSAFSGAAEYDGGLIKQSVDMGYEPKTLAGQKLLEIHTLLKEGLSGQEKPSNSQAFIEKSHLVTSEKKNEVFMLVADTENYHAAKYAKYFAEMMESRQDAGFKQLSERMKKIGSSNLDASDLYHFTSATEMLNKVSNTSAIFSKSAVEKFIDTNYANERQENKQEILNNIQVALDNKANCIVIAQDYLESRAADKFINMLDENAPTAIKGTDTFSAEVIQYFGARLGENAQEVQMDGYLSDFGHKHELLQQESRLLSHGAIPASINKDQLVFSFVSEMTNPSPERVNSAELEQGLKSVSELIQAHYQDIKPTLDAELTLTKEKEKSYGQDHDNDHALS